MIDNRTHIAMDTSIDTKAVGALAFRLIWFLPIIILMAACNWIVDPARELRPESIEASGTQTVAVSYEDEIAADMQAGRTHDCRHPVDFARLWNSLLATRDFTEPDVLVLGSSLSFPIHQKLYPDERLLNAAIPAADISDWIGVYEFFRQRNVRPGRVVIGVDPVALRVPPDHLRDMIEAETIAGFRRLGLSSVRHVRVSQRATGALRTKLFDRFVLLFSPRYFQFCLRVAYKNLLSNSEAAEARPASAIGEIPPEERIVIAPDGSRDWSPKLRNRSLDEIRADVGDQTFPLWDCSSVDDEARKYFETFITDLQRSKIEVEIVLVPTNPRYVHLDNGEQAPTSDGMLNRPLAERYVRQFAKEHNIQVRGSYNPRNVGMSESDFVDASHVRREAIDKLWP